MSNDFASQPLQHAAISDVGMRRANNQDSFTYVVASDMTTWRDRGHLFMVADGMGAHAAGELASKLAVDNIPHTYHKLADLPAPAAIEKAIHDANTLIHSRGQDNSDFHGMGTTCSVMILLPQGALVAHVGDSRVYRLRNHSFEQLSFDHSLVWEMAASGQMNDESVPDIIPKNVITRSLGPQPQVKVDLEGPLPVQRGDKYLLCSDGLTGPVTDDEIGVILECLPLEEAVATLIDIANLRGGPDNITVVAAHITGDQPAADGEVDSDEGGAAHQSVHPIFWVGSIVCLLAAAVMGVVGQPLATGVALLAGVGLGGIALLQKFGREVQTAKERIPGGPFGKGPYRHYDVTPSKRQLESLVDLHKQLADAAKNRHWKMDEAQVEKLTHEARSAHDRGDYKAAVVNYCHLIRFMLAEIRKSKAARTNR